MASTSPERWRTLSGLLDQALDLEVSERATFLAGACGDDDGLRRELDELLRACEREGFLDQPVARPDALIAGLSDAGMVATDYVAAGTRIGPFRVLREAGRGGMGAVYEAERADEQFHQRVALKIVRHTLAADAQFVRRFLDERQLLATLEHPNIARLVDGGVTADGVPWFAMEFVEGEPIDRFCDAHRLTIDDRLTLFAGVCDAVQYAHRQLIVHRDLKPSNILVTREGTAKLLDFGIARLVAAQDTDGGDEGARLLTPQYASPEQILGGRITTASDVYALGAILFALLSGKRPYRLADTTVTAMGRAVQEHEVLPPSVAVTAPPADADAAAARSTTVDRLSRRVRGDLDAIVLKAMRKSPENRYPSADGLGADIRRHLTNHPVIARADTLRYRAGRFAQRNRIGVVAAAALALALLGGMGTTARQARVASREAAKAREVTAFITGLFQVSDPNESRGREITARELLETGTQRVDSALAGQPEVQTEMLRVLGVIHGELGLYGRADTILRRTVDHAAATYGPEHLEVARALTHWGNVRTALGDYTFADSILRRALAIRRRRLGEMHEDVGVTLQALAWTELRRTTAASAESLFRKALEIDRRAFGNDHLRVATSLHDLGNALWQNTKYDAADSAHREALAIRERHLDVDHPLVTLSKAMLADVQASKAQYVEAERLQRDVVERRRRLYPKGHPDLAISLFALAFTLEMSGQYGAAEKEYEEALAVRRQHLGPDHPETIATTNNLAVVRYRMGELTGAETAFREVIAGWTRSLGAEHLRTLTAINNLGATLSDAHRFDEAELYLRQALAGRRKVGGDESADVAASYRNLGQLLYRAHREPVEAERILRESLRIYRAKLPERHPRTAETLTALGALLVQRGRAAEAEPLLREALAIRKKKPADQDWRIAETERPLGATLAAVGRQDEAESLLVDSYRRFRQSGRSARETSESVSELVKFYEARGNRVEADRYRLLARRP